MQNSNLHFHQTFAPEREHLSKLLALATDMPPMTKEEIFGVTGIPTGRTSGKVEPHIDYTIYMGLIDDNRDGKKHQLTRTELGELIYYNDPHMLETVTMLICHYNLSSPSTGAALWNFLFQKAVTGLGREISQEVLINIVEAKFSQTRVNLTPIKTCYTTEKCFGNLNVITVDDDKNWSFASLPYRSEYRYVYAYTLLSTWEKCLPKRMELTLGEVISELHWNKPFVWNERESLHILESLHELGVITLSKQLSPISVIKHSNSELVANQIYSNLL